MDGSCAPAMCQTLRMPRGSNTIDLKKQSICLPFLHCGTLELWLPHRWGFQPWGAGEGLCSASSALPSRLLVLLCLTRAFTEPQTLLSHKINLMPLGIFLVLGLPWCLCVLVPCTFCPCQVFKKNTSSCSPSCPAHLGAACVQGAECSLCFFCRISLGLCQGQKLSQMDFATIHSGTY